MQTYQFLHPHRWINLQQLEGKEEAIDLSVDICILLNLINY